MPYQASCPPRLGCVQLTKFHPIISPCYILLPLPTIPLDALASLTHLLPSNPCRRPQISTHPHLNMLPSHWSCCGCGQAQDDDPCSIPSSNHWVATLITLGSCKSASTLWYDVLFLVSLLSKARNPTHQLLVLKKSLKCLSMIKTGLTLICSCYLVSSKPAEVWGKGLSNPSTSSALTPYFHKFLIVLSSVSLTSIDIGSYP